MCARVNRTRKLMSLMAPLLQPEEIWEFPRLLMRPTQRFWKRYRTTRTLGIDIANNRKRYSPLSKEPRINMRDPNVPESLEGWWILHRMFAFDRRAWDSLSEKRR